MKLFRKIRETLIEERNLRKYLLYAIGEILLVMISILLAFQINNWNTNRIKRNTELKYYQNIKHQINEDRQEIIGNIDYNNTYLDQYKFAVQVIEAKDKSKIDTLGYIAFKLLKYSDFNRQSNIYETMVNSGEIKLLNNPRIIEGLRSLEGTYIYINKMENIHYEVIINSAFTDLRNNIKFSTRKVERPDKLFTFEFQNLIIIIISIMEEKDEIYNRAIDEIEAITELLDEELNSQ